MDVGQEASLIAVGKKPSHGHDEGSPWRQNASKKEQGRVGVSR